MDDKLCFVFLSQISTNVRQTLVRMAELAETLSTPTLVTVQLDLRETTAKLVRLTAISFSLIYSLFTYMILDVNKQTNKQKIIATTPTHTCISNHTHTHT